MNTKHILSLPLLAGVVILMGGCQTPDALKEDAKRAYQGVKSKYKMVKSKFDDEDKSQKKEEKKEVKIVNNSKVEVIKTPTIKSYSGVVTKRDKHGSFWYYELKTANGEVLKFNTRTYYPYLRDRISITFNGDEIKNIEVLQREVIPQKVANVNSTTTTNTKATPVFSKRHTDQPGSKQPAALPRADQLRTTRPLPSSEGSKAEQESGDTGTAGQDTGRDEGTTAADTQSASEPVTASKQNSFW